MKQWEGALFISNCITTVISGDKLRSKQVDMIPLARLPSPTSHVHGSGAWQWRGRLDSRWLKESLDHSSSILEVGPGVRRWQCTLLVHSSGNIKPQRAVTDQGELGMSIDVRSVLLHIRRCVLIRRLLHHSACLRAWRRDQSSLQIDSGC